MSPSEVPTPTPMPSTEQPPEGVSRVVQGAHQTIDALHQHTREWRGLQQEWTECARITVRENPLAALATAAAVGALIGLLCSRH